MSKKTVTVPNISCGHCTNTIEMELSDLAGVTAVSTNQENKEVTVEWSEPATWEKIDALLREINYAPA